MACPAYETIVDRRLQWSVWSECAACGDTEQECGWDETPDEVRRALLDQCGTFRLHVRPTPAFSRVLLMRALRAEGTSVADVSATLDRLLTDGLPGTETELHLLGMKLERAGVAATVHRSPS